MTAATRTQEPINWQAVYKEALDIFVRYLRIPSVNPPGNEAPAARFLGSLVEAAGVSCEYIETEPNREAVVARLKGDGSKGTLMLGNHLDVVPVEADFWDMPPFEGVIKDGFVYGRGAVDMKGAGVMQLMAFLLLARRGTPLKRDVINTLNVTTIHAGTKINVIPALSEATLDCRLLPGADAEEWRQQVIDRIDDPRIEVSFANFRSETKECDWDTELFHVIQQVVSQAMEDAVVLPTMTVGGTDNRFLRDRGIPAYGFIPVLLSADEAAGFHGNNEKLSIENLNLGCELTYEVVRRFCS
jgi:acetylornithine deacetylase/succinyl-diaminopimelate desuccinylase-like protein